MFTYKHHLPITLEITRPDPSLYHALQKMEKENQIFKQFVELMRGYFVIQEHQVRDIFAMIAARELTNMEVLAKLAVLLQGLDAGYIDCIDLNNPVFEWIQRDDEKDVIKPSVYPDVCAMILQQQKQDEKIRESYIDLMNKSEDQGVKAIMSWLCVGKDMNLKQWDKLLEHISNPTIHKDFSEGALDDQDHVLDSGNYFDRPNPYFLNDK